MRSTEEFFETYREKLRNFEGSFEERLRYEAFLFEEWYKEAQVGDRMHILHWSDITPCTVIGRTRATITVRMDKGTLDPNWKPEFEIGGFAAHCTNNDEQVWIIEEDPDGYVETFRWHKNSNCFENKSGEKVLPEWGMKYDYNF